jgi:hypothetical protein
MLTVAQWITCKRSDSMVILARKVVPDGRVLFDIVQLLVAIAVITGIAALQRARQNINVGWKHLAAGPTLHGE